MKHLHKFNEDINDYKFIKVKVVNPEWDISPNHPDEGYIMMELYIPKEVDDIVMYIEKLTGLFVIDYSKSN